MVQNLNNNQPIVSYMNSSNELNLWKGTFKEINLKGFYFLFDNVFN
jgi:hypothetical protein